MAVVGASSTEPDIADIAVAVGRHLADLGAIVVCGGLGGVMEAACRGAKSAGGTTVGILPGTERGAANPWVDVALPTGLGEARNAIVVAAADALVAVGGGYGTLSEIALALKAAKPVVGIRTWDLPAIVGVNDPREAARMAVELASGRHSSTERPTGAPS